MMDPISQPFVASDNGFRDDSLQQQTFSAPRVSSNNNVDQEQQHHVMGVFVKSNRFASCPS